MTPKLAVKKDDNLLISTIENGYQDGNSFFKVLELFNNWLENNEIKKPVVLLSGVEQLSVQWTK